MPGRACARPGTRPAVTGSLLDGDRGAGAFQGGLGLLRGLLVDPLQERLRRGVHQVLGLLEAQAGQGADCLLYTSDAADE